MDSLDQRQIALTAEVNLLQFDSDAVCSPPDTVYLYNKMGLFGCDESDSDNYFESIS